MKRLRFTIPGEPAPKGSRTVGKRKDGTVYTRPASKHEKPWRTMAAQALWVTANRQGVKFTAEPIRLTVCFAFKRPHRPKREWPTRIDVDKALRNLFDALVEAGVVPDDKHIVRVDMLKCFVEGQPHTTGVVETGTAAPNMLALGLVA